MNFALRLVMQKCHSSDAAKQIVPSGLVLIQKYTIHAQSVQQLSVTCRIHFFCSTPLVLAVIHLLQSAKTDLLIQLEKYPSKVKAITR